MAADRGDATAVDGADAFAAAARFIGDEGLFRREDGETRRLSLTLYRLIAAGRPVAVADLGAAAGLGDDRVQAILGGLPASNIEFDAAGAMVGFRGLSQRPTRHTLRVDGRTLYGWCAFDTLFLPEILGRPAEVRSTCPATGADIRLGVTPAGVTAAEPADTAMSFVMPEDPRYRDDIRATFCRHVCFLAGRDAGTAWRARSPAAVILTLDEAHALGRIRNRAGFGDALGRGG